MMFKYLNQLFIILANNIISYKKNCKYFVFLGLLSTSILKKFTLWKSLLWISLLLIFNDVWSLIKWDSKIHLGLKLKTWDLKTLRLLRAFMNTGAMAFLWRRCAMKCLWNPHSKLLLKLVSAIFYRFFIFSPNDSPLKTVKNVFYFI